MALQNSNYRETANYKGWYDSGFRSTYSLKLTPQTFGEVVKRYGKGLSMTTFAHMAGRVMPLKGRSITIFEEGAPYRPVKVSIATDAAPVSGTTVTLNVADGSDAYMRQYFSIIIPAAYTNKSIPQELRITGSAGSWLGSFADVTAAITTALSDVYVAVGASSFGFGTGQPDPMATGVYSRTTNSRIIKSTAAIEGGTLAQEEYAEFDTVDGGRGVWTKSIAELDFDLDNQIDSALFTGQAFTNTAITQLSTTGATKAVPSFDGLNPLMASLAQEVTWDSTGFGLDTFRSFRPLLENVGVVNENLDLFAGSDLNSSIETEMFDLLSTNAGGTKYWDEINKVGFMVNSIKFDGVQTNVAVLHALSNPNKFGLSSYTFKKEGFLFTQGEYKATLQDGGADQAMRLPHLTLGYPSHNGENRQRVFMMAPGVHGIQGMPNIATNDYDAVKMYGLMDLLPIYNHLYKTIKVNYDASEGAGA